MSEQQHINPQTGKVAPAEMANAVQDAKTALQPLGPASSAAPTIVDHAFASVLPASAQASPQATPAASISGTPGSPATATPLAGTNGTSTTAPTAPSSTPIAGGKPEVQAATGGPNGPDAGADLETPSPQGPLQQPKARSAAAAAKSPRVVNSHSEDGIRPTAQGDAYYHEFTPVNPDGSLGQPIATLELPAVQKGAPASGSHTTVPTYGGGKGPGMQTASTTQDMVPSARPDSTMRGKLSAESAAAMPTPEPASDQKVVIGGHVGPKARAARGPVVSA